jgi:hypothetical protein
MKHLFTSLFYLLSFGAVLAQANVQVLSKSRNETLLKLELGNIHKSTVSTPQGDALVISMDNGTPLLEAGAPDVPKFATTLMIPNTGNMAVEIMTSEYTDYPNVPVAPSKGNLMRNVDPASIAYHYGTAYERNAFFPGKLASLNQPFIMRDVRGQALWIYPVQYNAVTKTLRVYQNITVRVHHIGGQGENEAGSGRERVINTTFRQLYQKLFLNFDEQFLTQNRSNEDPVKMLVIAKDDLIPGLESYVAWKRQMGIHTTIVPTSEVGSAPAEVFEYVQNYYNENQISYLLLVGNENAITPMVRPGSNYSCDNCLGYMEGSDHYPEIFVGRFHASNLSELAIMTARNLSYEKSPLLDTLNNWCAMGMASASNEGQGIGDDNQADYQHANEWKANHLADNYERYWEFYDGNHAAISPTPGDETADKPGDPQNTALVAVMNSPGVSIYNYTGHGWEQGLASGNFNTDAVKNLRNFQRYPIVIAVACCAGNFTNNGGGDCLGEAMQRAGDPATGEPWGGIAGFYSSDFQSWAPPMEGQDGMNQYLVDADGVTLDPDLGAMATYGNALMIAAYGQGGIDMADVWNPFHDPTTVPRTALPKALIATHASELIIGANSLQVTCDVEGALVSLYWQGQALAVATVTGGVAQLNFPGVSDVGELMVTVTQFNYRPYQGIVNVAPGAGAYVISQAIVLDDAAGNNDQKADYNENILLNLTLNNLGDQIAQATSATLQTDDLNVNITDNTEVFGDMTAGAIQENTAAFAFKVNDDVANGHTVLFKLRIEFNGGQVYEANYSVKIQAPELEANGLQISDLTGGDGDNRLESSEQAVITIKNLNVGLSKSPDAWGTLTSNSPWLTIDGPVNLGPIDAVTGTADASFLVSVSANAPQVVTANFEYLVEAGNYTAQQSFGPYIINPIIETYESQNYASFPWDMEGNKPWFVSPSSAYTGTYSSRSGIITHSQQSVMNLTLNFTEPGMVIFARRVGSEQDYDFLRFLIDDVQVDAWSGVVPWGEVSYPLTPGIHKLSWIYQKDDISSANGDRAWVDDVFLPPHQVLVGTSNPAQADYQTSLSPNPTNGKTWLQWEIAQAQEMDIVVLDALGHQVLNLTSEGLLQPGLHSRTLDLQNLSAGLYFVQLRGEAGVQVKKVVKQ